MKNFRQTVKSPAVCSNVPAAASGLSEGVLEGLEARTLMSAAPSSVVFIADNVADRASLTRAFAGAEVVMLDSQGDVFAQVSRALEGRGGLASIQFVTHGSAGRVQLGSGEGQTLDAGTLASLAGTISTWGDALAEDGDVVLWGCQVAMGDVGRSFVSELASTMRADAAASFNLTGSSRLGGDWTLELKLGKIEALSGFVAPVRYAGVLASPTIGGTAAGQTVNETGTIRPFSAVVIGSEDPAAVLSVSVALDDAAKGIFTPASLTASGFANAGGGVYTFTGTAAQATVAISRLVFNPADNRVNTGQTETTTFTITANNGVDPATVNSATTVVSTAVNQVPVISGTFAGQTVNDNATIQPFASVVVTDPDAPGQTLTVLVGADDAEKGTFTAGSLTATGFVDAGNGFFSFSGTAAQVTTALQGLVFQPAGDRLEVGQNEVVQFDIRVSDGVAPEVRDATTSVTVSAANDQPTITGASAGQAVNDNATITPFSGMTIGDADIGQILSVTLSVDDAAKGAFTAASLAAGGWVAGGGSGTWTFTGTAAQATLAIRGLVFNPTNDRVAVGQTETATFTVTVTDSVAAPVINSGTTVVSTSINDNPTITGATAGQAVNDNATVSPFSGMTIGDVDNPAQTLSVSVTIDDAAKGVFTAGSLTASGFVDAGGGVYTFSGTAAQATTAIRALVFNPTNDRVAVGLTETSTFTVDVTDSEAGAASNTTTTVVSTSINDNPTITGAAAGQAVNDNATVTPFSGVTIGDVDNPAQTLTISVTIDDAAKGVFTSGSLTASGFVDAGGGVYTFSGTAADATTAIRALVFNPTNDRVAVGQTETSTFSISVTDSETGSASNATTTVVSTSINDNPTITGAATGQAVNDNATVSPFSGVTIGDVDNPAQTLTVSVTIDDAAKGVFTSGSLTASGFVDAGGGVYTFSGTAAEATTAIRALVFNPTNDRVAVGQTETSTFTVLVTDSEAGSSSDSDTTVISTSINDNPTITGATAGQAVNDNATVSPFSGMTIGDVDNPAQTLTVSVTIDDAAKGVFTAGSLTTSGFVDAGGGVYTFSGTAAQATTAIRALVFNPANDRVAVGQTETSTFTVDVTDSETGTASNGTVTVVSTSINDAPVIGGTVAGQAVNDNATVSPFSGVTISDTDPGQQMTVTVTLDAASKGAFTSGSLTASGFVDAGGGVYTFTGTAGQVTTAIQALVFAPTANRVAVGQTETSAFTISVNDVAPDSATDTTTTVVSTSMNDAPTVTGAVAGQAVNDNATITPFSGVTIADVDPSDPLTVTVTLDGAAQGVFTAGSLTSSGFVDSGGGVYTFTGSASEATAAIRALVFRPTENRVAVGQTETTGFEISVTDGAAANTANTVTTAVSTSINDQSTITGAVAAQAVDDESTITPFASLTIGDVDSPAQSLTVTVTLDAAAKGVFTPASLTASGFVDAGGGVYTFTGTAADATTAIRALVFEPTNDRVNPGSTETTTFGVQVDDGFSTVSNSTTTVVTTPVNDAPQLTVPGGAAGQAVNDNATLQPFSGVTIADADASQPVTVTVTLDDAAKGVFTAGSLTASGFVASGGGVYTFTGTAADATTAIRALVFDAADNRVTPGDTETTTFTINVNDQFATAVSDNTATVISTSINDLPTVSGAAAGQAVNDNATISPFSGVTIGDVDHPAQSLTVTVTLDSTAKGEFTSASLTASGFVDAGGGVYTFTGTAAQATTAIRALVFNPADNRVAVNQTETSSFQVEVDDGSGQTVSNTTTTVVSLSVNDAPTIDGTAAGQAVNDNATVTPFTGVTIGDVDNPAQTLTVTVALDSAAKGSFTAGSLTASGFVSSGGGVWTFSGTAADATVAIRQLVFQPTANRVNPGQTETTTFTLLVNDGTGNPSPSTTTSDSTTTVVSTSINDAPTLAGAAAGQAVNDSAVLQPFSGFTVGDPDINQPLTVTVTLDDASKGEFTSTSLNASGFTHVSDGVYTFTGTAAQATAAIRSLVFNPSDNRVVVGATETSTFTVEVNDAIATPLSNGTTTVVATSVNDAPTLTGAVAGQQVNENATISPFTGVTITDPDFNQFVNVFVSMDNAARGEFTEDSLIASGFVQIAPGFLSFNGSAADATAALQQLVFAPADNRVAIGSRETTRFTVSVNDVVSPVVVNNTTTVQSLSLNDAPVVGTLGASPGSVQRQTTVTLTASDVTDPDNAVLAVDFYRDSNGNGELDIGIDALVGTSTVTGGSASVTVSTGGMTLGETAFFARARDVAGLAGTSTNGSLTVTNRLPSVTAVASSVTAVNLPGNALTLTASGAADLDGSIAAVRFYLDDGDGVFDAEVDTLLGQDASSAGGFTLAVDTSALESGIRRVFAAAVDNDGDMSTAVTTTFRMNAAPTVSTLASSATEVNRRTSITLTASGVADSDGTVSRIEFYRDSNGNGQFDPGVDALLGSDTTATGGQYTLAVSTTGYAAGDTSFFARAVDNNGRASEAQSVDVTINNVAPRITSVAASTTVVANPGAALRLTASGASDTDGTVSQVRFFLDDGDGVFNAVDDTLLGNDTTASTGLYTLAVDTASIDAGVRRVFAVTVDNDGALSTAATTTFRMNAAPSVTTAASSVSSVNRRTSFTLTGSGVSDTDGTIARVEFFRDSNNNGTLDVTDTKLGSDTTSTAGAYTFAVSTSTMPAGLNRFFVRAVDNNGGLGEAQSVSVTINNLTPTITSVAVSRTVVATPGVSVTLTASGAADADGPVSGVQFFLDDGDGTFDADTDTLLGTDTTSSNGFTFAVNTSSMTPGIKRVFARTRDADGAFSTPVTNTFRVNAAPTLAGFAASVTPISRTATFTLTATDPADSDGTISRIEFYRDRGVLGTFEAGTDALLGNATLVGGVWRLSLNGSVFSAAGTYTLFARAVDNNGAFSAVQSIVVQVA